MTTAGDLRFRVRFDKWVAIGDDPGGGSKMGWQGQFTRSADIKPMKGGEGVVAARLSGTQPVLIIVRFDSQTCTIDPSWRAVEVRNTIPVRFYALKTAEDMERRRMFITMTAVAGDADGGDGSE